MKQLVVAAVAACIVTAGSAAFAVEGKIGYIDMQRAIGTSDAGKEAKEQMAARLKKSQDEVNARQDELKRLKDELEKQGSLLSDSARTAKEKDYQQKLKDFQRFAKDAQDDLQAKDDELTRKILGGLEKVIQDFGKKNGYTFIFVRNEGIMLYSDEKADLTNDILKLYNAGRKK
jgi:outer membrane protein